MAKAKVKITLNSSEFRKELNKRELDEYLKQIAFTQAEKIPRVHSKHGGNADEIFIFRSRSKARSKWRIKQLMKWQTNIAKLYRRMTNSSNGKILD